MPKVVRLNNNGAVHPQPEITLPNNAVAVPIKPELVFEYENPECLIVYTDIVRSIDELIINEYKSNGGIVTNIKSGFCSDKTP